MGRGYRRRRRAKSERMMVRNVERLLREDFGAGQLARAGLLLAKDRVEMRMMTAEMRQAMAVKRRSCRRMGLSDLNG